MQCKKCGKRLKKNEKFCTVCGFYNGDFQNDEWKDESADLLKEEISVPEGANNEEVEGFSLKADASGTKEDEYYYENENFLESFIGEDYKLIKKSPFNIFAFLLNWMYFLYRKLYITGIVGLSITLIVFLFFRSAFLIYAVVTIIILGFVFNPYYIFISKKKVERIKVKYEGTDNFNLMTICAEKGGVNVIFALIIYFVFLLILFLNMVNIHFNRNHNTRFWNENSEHKATCSSLVKAAYKDFTDQKAKGTLEEGVCKLNSLSSSRFDVYLKLSQGNQKIYYYYTTENDYIIYKSSTDKKSELEIKKANKSITADETKTLNEINGMENTYNSIIIKASDEDTLIKKKKNKEEKKNFVFSKEEIIR